MTTANTAMPQLGVGTFRLEGQVAYQSVMDALDLGYRHIDTAQIYGNEEAVGQAIKDSGIDRDHLFVTTKVWNAQLTQSKVLPSVEESLRKLKLDYVDLLLVHWPSPPNNEPMEAYLTQMLEAREKQYTKHMGVSNFTIAHLEEAKQVASASDIFTNQVEVHPYLVNQTLRDYSRAQGIHITGYMPFAVGKVLKDHLIKDIAEQHGVTPAEVVVAWELGHGMATIPSSTKKANLATNLKGAELTLSTQEMKAIDGLDCGDRQATPDFSPVWDK